MADAIGLADYLTQSSKGKICFRKTTNVFLKDLGNATASQIIPVRIFNYLTMTHFPDVIAERNKIVC